MPPTTPNAVALIPARSGSARCPGKNTRRLNGHPLLAYTIQAALDAGVFNRKVWVSSDDERTLDIAAYYGAQPIKRPASIATGTSPDIRWVRHALDHIGNGRDGLFAILRPTSPFRTANTILRAWRQFVNDDQTCDTLRAVSLAPCHPAKMWLHVESAMPMKPVLEGQDGQTPWHSMPTQRLPPVYVQNGSLEFCYGHIVYDTDRITGRKICPFNSHGDEGVDINTEADWEEAQDLAYRNPGLLPVIGVRPCDDTGLVERPPDSRGAVAGGSWV